METLEGLKYPRRVRMAIGAAIVLLFAVCYARNDMLGYLSGPDFLLALVLAGLMVMYCVADSKVVGVRLINSFRWLMFFTWPLAVPVYFLWSRGFRGLVHIAAFILIVVLIRYGVFYTLWFLTAAWQR